MPDLGGGVRAAHRERRDEPQLRVTASVTTLLSSNIALIVRTQRPHLAVQQSEA